MGEWLHGCQLCNEGVIVEMKKIIETGVSVNKASKILAEMAAKQIGEELFTAEAIRNRYRFHVGQREPNPKVGHNDQPKIQKPEKASDSGILPVNQVQLELPLEVGPKCLEPQEKSVCPQMEELGVDYIVNRQKAAARAQQRQESELGRADRAIRRAARLMEMIVEGQIENNGSDIDQLSAASIKRHGPGIIISFIQLGIDVFKVHEFYMGRKGGVSETAIELSDFTMQETCKQRVPDLPPYVQ